MSGFGVEVQDTDINLELLMILKTRRPGEFPDNSVVKTPHS